MPEDQARRRVQSRDLRPGERFEGVMITPLRPFDQVPSVHDRLWFDAGIRRVSMVWRRRHLNSFPDT